MEFNTSAVNTVFLTITMALIGIVSFVVKSLLEGIQTQLGLVLRTMQELVADTVQGRVEAVGQVEKAIASTGALTDLRLERLTRAVELSARTDLLRLMASPDLRPEIKEQANKIIEEIANSR